MLTKQTRYILFDTTPQIRTLWNYLIIILILSFYCWIVLFKAKNDFFIKRLSVLLHLSADYLKSTIFKRFLLIISFIYINEY